MSFSQPFPLFQSPISSPAAAAAAAQKHLPAPKQPLLLLLLLLTEESQEHLPAPKQQGTEGRTCRFFNPISPPAAAAVAAAANRRVARAPPGTKTARHGRTNMPQNRTEKVPNVPSEFLEKMFFFPTFSAFSIPSAHLLLLLPKSTSPHQNSRCCCCC